VSKSKRKYVNDPEWVERVAKAGIEKHRKNGNVVDLGGAASSKILGPDGEVIGESTMSAADRRIAGALIAKAVESMATGEFPTWWECLETLREMLIDALWQHEQIMGLFQQIEDEAVHDCGDPTRGQVARHWLYQTRQELINMPAGGNA